MIVDQSIRDLHIILVTERCDMSYVISYFTQENVFIAVEIVFQSSCTCVASKLAYAYSCMDFPERFSSRNGHSIITQTLTVLSLDI